MYCKFLRKTCKKYNFLAKFLPIWWRIVTASARRGFYTTGLTHQYQRNRVFHQNTQVSRSGKKPGFWTPASPIRKYFATTAVRSRGEVCPMPYALCPMPYARRNMLLRKTIQTAFNVTEAWVLLKPIAIFLRSQTDNFAEGLAKVTWVVKSDLLGDIFFW